MIQIFKLKETRFLCCLRTTHCVVTWCETDMETIYAILGYSERANECHNYALHNHKRLCNVYKFSINTHYIILLHNNEPTPPSPSGILLTKDETSETIVSAFSSFIIPCNYKLLYFFAKSKKKHQKNNVRQKT